MLLWKFSVAFLVCLFLLKIGLAAPDAEKLKDCLKSSHQIKVEHKGAPFGLTSHKLEFKKEQCLLDIRYKYLFFPEEWRLDFCRAPIHLKKNFSGTPEVYKHTGNCQKTSESLNFCQSRDHLLEILENHALIFAEGNRDSLDSDHGKAYCNFILVKHYLGGKVFSLSEPPISLEVPVEEPIENQNPPESIEQAQGSF